MLAPAIREVHPEVVSSTSLSDRTGHTRWRHGFKSVRKKHAIHIRLLANKNINPSNNPNNRCIARSMHWLCAHWSNTSGGHKGIGWDEESEHCKHTHSHDRWDSTLAVPFWACCFFPHSSQMHFGFNGFLLRRLTSMTKTEGLKNLIHTDYFAFTFLLNHLKSVSKWSSIWQKNRLMSLVRAKAVWPFASQTQLNRTSFLSCRR